MARRKKQLPPVRITGFGRKGAGIGPSGDDRKVHIPLTMPGDLVEVHVTKQKKTHYEGLIQSFVEKSPDRIEPFCKHFDNCGGCSWQMVPYELQAKAKETEVQELFQKAQLSLDGFEPILRADKTTKYRNKMEFSFGASRWIPAGEMTEGEYQDERRGLGFYVPGRWDRILDLEECHLGDETLESIRSRFRAWTMEQDIPFYNQRHQDGVMRQLIIRSSLQGQYLVILVLNQSQRTEEDRQKILAHLEKDYPEITSLWYAVNDLSRDSFYELNIQHHSGDSAILETCGHIQLKIHPKSFYQTNPHQAQHLYALVREWADLSGTETIWDLYCGTGSIGLYLAGEAGSLLGIETISQAVDNARENARLNQVENARFHCGNVEEILTQQFLSENPRPDLVVLDPPRSGLHPKARKALLELAPQRIIYVSCNPKTQVDDLVELTQSYHIRKIRPVDMFPQTYHSENVVLLEKK